MALGFAFGVVCLLAFAGDAAAQNECVAQAGAEFKACSAECKESRRNDVAICRGHDPVCAQTCREGRDECTAPVVQANLTDCLDRCPNIDAARADCRADVGCGGQADPCGFDPAYISCLNPAQSAAFQCRDTCRDAYRLNAAAQDALKACKAAFKTCIESCPPPAEN
jgi:hypothetical protein